jgi:hypothetical protein
VTAHLIANRQFLPPLGAAAGEHIAAVTVGHSFAEAVLIAALPLRGIVELVHYEKVLIK